MGGPRISVTVSLYEIHGCLIRVKRRRRSAVMRIFVYFQSLGGQSVLSYSQNDPMSTHGMEAFGGARDTIRTDAEPPWAQETGGD